MADLTITQKKVLKVLGENEDKWLKMRDIIKLSGVNRLNVERAIQRFYDMDYVFIDYSEDAVQISLDGMEEYYNCFK